MNTLVRSKPTVAWAALTALTVISWLLGTHSFGGGHSTTSAVIFLVAIFKIRLVGLYFMELQDAPPPLRGAFEAYCIALLGLLIGMYLWA